ncbi:MAG: SIS domain-containing protein [Chloroflexota bacterium]|nr:SIS domain-containing protein [Chloroflexota bacterium]
MRQDLHPGQERLLSEIAEQPAVVARLLEQQADMSARVADAITQRQPRAVVLAARGSSDNAAVYGRYLFEICNGLLTSLAAPSTVTLYERGPRLDETVVIGVSQSGRGEDVVSYVRRAREHGATTVAIVNDAGSPLAEVAEWVLDCLAGPEVSVPATKTVSAQMALLALVSIALEGANPSAVLAHLPSALEQAIALRVEARILAQAIAGLEDLAVIGRGFAFSTALELALKLKETSYSQAEPFSAADFFHGPVALVDRSYGALLVDVGGASTGPALQTAREVQERGGCAFLLRAGEVRETEATQTLETVGVPTVTLASPVPEPYAPMLALVLGQLVAVEVALARGLDPAQPRGLRKVTSTR